MLQTTMFGPPPADLSHWPTGRRPRLLDLFCCEGGASAGYAAAGFEVVGVDRSPMPKYPFEFLQRDVLELTPEFLRGFDAISASPPCKVHTALKAFSDESHEDLVPQTRALLRASGRPYIIENVPGAPLIDPVTLCGSMFDLFVRRHRLFETNWPLSQPRCRHAKQERESPGFEVKYYHTGEPVVHKTPVVTVVGRGGGMGEGEIDVWRSVMEMDWASKDGLREAIPPAYTKWIGEQLLEHVRAAKQDEETKTMSTAPIDDTETRPHMTPERIRAIRMEAGLTQTELAQMMKMSDRRTVRRWEKGQVPITGPASIVLELFAAGKLPRRYRGTISGQTPAAA